MDRVSIFDFLNAMIERSKTKSIATSVREPEGVEVWLEEAIRLGLDRNTRAEALGDPQVGAVWINRV